MRPSIWLGGIPLLAAALGYWAAFALRVPGEDTDLVAPAAVAGALCALLVCLIALRHGARAGTAARWGLGAGAMTLAFSTIPFFLFLATCDQCLQ
jgi:hypothetical protein